MGDLFRRSCHCCSIALLLLIAVVSATAQENPTSSADTVFVFVQKTSEAANFGSRQLFEHVVNFLQEYLKANKIASVFRTDDFSSGLALPLSAVQEMARNVNATYLLYVVVDRPVMKWLKLTVECYNASGQPLWAEEASAAKEFSRGNRERDTLQHLHKKLDARIGQPGLRSATFEEQQTPTKAPGSTSVSGAQPTTTSAAATPAANRGDSRWVSTTDPACEWHARPFVRGRDDFLEDSESGRYRKAAGSWRCKGWRSGGHREQSTRGREDRNSRKRWACLARRPR